jgi:hypothetical protein
MTGTTTECCHASFRALRRLVAFHETACGADPFGARPDWRDRWERGRRRSCRWEAAAYGADRLLHRFGWD